MKRINITLQESLLTRVDSIAKEEKINRSEFFRKIVRLYEQIRKEEEKRKKRKEAIKKAIMIQDELRENTPSWNGIAELKRQREANR